MEVKKYNPFVVIKPKPTGSTRERSSKTELKPQVKPKPKVKLVARGLALENEKKLDIFYAKGFVNTNEK